MLVLKLFLFTNFLIFCVCQVVRVVQKNPLLSRKKRYLNFPMGSNFIVSAAATKSLMMVQPKGFNVIYEIEVPFGLPSDTRMLFKNYKEHLMKKREIFNQIERAFKMAGFNGNACLRKIQCAFYWSPYEKGKSLILDLLHAIFFYQTDMTDLDADRTCSNETLDDECDFPELNLLLNALGD